MNEREENPLISLMVYLVRLGYSNEHKTSTALYQCGFDTSNELYGPLVLSLFYLTFSKLRALWQCRENSCDSNMAVPFLLTGLWNGPCRVVISALDR